MESTRERLLDAAGRLFEANGYHATGVASILREADANSGSLYHYFPTKQALLIGVLERYRDELDGAAAEAEIEADDPLEALFDRLDGYRRRLIETDFEYTPPVVSLAYELRSPDPLVRRKLAQGLTAWRRGIEACLVEAADRLPGGVDATALAGYVVALLQGAILLTRVYRDIEAFDACVAQLRGHFDALSADATVTAGPRAT